MITLSSGCQIDENGTWPKQVWADGQEIKNIVHRCDNAWCFNPAHVSFFVTDFGIKVDSKERRASRYESTRVFVVAPEIQRVKDELATIKNELKKPWVTIRKIAAAYGVYEARLSEILVKSGFRVSDSKRDKKFDKHKEVLINEEVYMIRMYEIVEYTEKLMNLSKGAIMSKDRSDDVATGRALTMYICRKYGGFSYVQLAEAFNRHHATVIHNCAKVEANISTEGYTELVDSLVDFVKEHEIVYEPMYAKNKPHDQWELLSEW